MVFEGVTGAIQGVSRGFRGFSSLERFKGSQGRSGESHGVSEQYLKVSRDSGGASGVSRMFQKAPGSFSGYLKV